jgi:hypothetical protein
VAGRPTKLTPEVHHEVVSYIRAGAFSWVAAQAAGVSKTTFHRWMQRGSEEQRGPYHAFAEDVRQAQAQARVAAEAEVRRLQPFHWLRYGPGRERPGEPGWTEQVVVVDERSEQLEALDQMSVQELRRALSKLRVRAAG